VFSAALIPTEMVFGVSSIPPKRFFWLTIHQNLSIFQNCCVQLNQQLQPLLKIPLCKHCGKNVSFYFRRNFIVALLILR
jgi:hypothetical protein